MATGQRSRFEKKIRIDNETGCWIWTGAYGTVGYGNCSIGSMHMGAHRAAYILYIGQIPSGMEVCHRCDNRACVNPDHLFLGTQADNLQDMRTKGRQGRNPWAKLTEAQVREMRLLHTSGVRVAEIARTYGVLWHTADDAIRGRTWRRVR